MPGKDDLLTALLERARATSDERWQAERVRWSSDGVVLEVLSSGEPFRVTAFLAAPPARWYREAGGVAFSYQTTPSRPLRGLEQQHLDRLINALLDLTPSILERLHSGHLSGSQPGGRDGAGEPGFPTAEALAALASPFALSPDDIEAYRRDGFVVLRGVLDPKLIEAARPAILSGLSAHWPSRHRDPSDAIGGYAQAFVQVTNVGVSDGAVRAFSHAPRIGRIAAQLMGVSGTRLYCEDWLLKQPGDAATGWHQDACVFPLETAASITAWIPIQAVPVELGLVRYAVGSQRLGLCGEEQITASSDRAFAELIAREGLEIVEVPPFALGDVCFHNGLTIHGAAPNRGTVRRDVLALHMFADGARVVAPRNETMAHQLRQFGPDLSAGDPAESAFWPIINSRSGDDGWSRLRATLIPGGVERDLWIHGDTLRFEGPADAPTLAAAGGYVLSGLVDSHCHVSWPHTRDTPSHTVAFMNANRLIYARMGVTALRDMGSDRDEVCALRDEPGYPRIQATGTMLLRDDTWPLTNTPPGRLVDAVRARLASGARWLKLFADFSSDFQGRQHPGFTATDALTYSLEELSNAVELAHAGGARVAAHCFSRAGAEVAVAAGVDSLEHGWAIDEELLLRMSRGGIAWVPLIGIASAMYEIAKKHGETATRAWIVERMDAMRHLLPRAVELGVRVFAGTDWFPNPTVLDEMSELRAAGLSSEGALASGTYAARDWLGWRGLEDGAPADLILCRRDPRQDFRALADLELIVIGGQPVVPSAQCSSHVPWASIRARHEEH